MNIDIRRVAVLSWRASVVASAALFVVSSPVAHAAPVETVTDNTFQTQVLDRSKSSPVAVAFMRQQATCTDCGRLQPVLAELAAENRILLAALDVDTSRTTAVAYKVGQNCGIACTPLSPPVVIVFQNGVAAKRIVGYKNKQDLLNELQPFVGAAPTGQFRTATVTGDVDIYDVPGGVGNVIGMLEGGEGQRVQAKCRDDRWCEVSGQGWVWGEFLQF